MNRDNVWGQLIAETGGHKGPLWPGAYPNYKDMDFTGNSPFHTFYPDGSRSFDDIISVICKITADNSPLHSILAAFPLQHKSGGTRYFFEDGFRQPAHTHNFIELDYVAEGRFYKQIEGHDYIFEKGDIILIDKDISHTEYLYRRKSAVLCLRIANTFFDKSMRLDAADPGVKDFFQRFIINGNRKYHFIRFIPQDNKNGDKLNDTPRVPDLLDQILSELWKPHPGSTHLVIGFVEWLLNLLPREYRPIVQWNNRSAAQRTLFEEVRRYLNEHYQNVFIHDLIEKFGHNMNYFNLLIKRHTGMTYSGFLQDIRLRQAELFLKTTDFPVEEIARRAGYENQTYFYKIFYKKFGMKPNGLRNKSE